MSNQKKIYKNSADSLLLIQNDCGMIDMALHITVSGLCIIKRLSPEFTYINIKRNISIHFSCLRDEMIEPEIFLIISGVYIIF